MSPTIIHRKSLPIVFLPKLSEYPAIYPFSPLQLLHHLSSSLKMPTISLPPVAQGFPTNLEQMPRQTTSTPFGVVVEPLSAADARSSSTHNPISTQPALDASSLGAVCYGHDLARFHTYDEQNGDINTPGFSYSEAILPAQGHACRGASTRWYCCK